MKSSPNSSNATEGPMNHLTARPTVFLTETIQAVEIIPPHGKNSMSMHKIWIPPNKEYPSHTHPSPHIITVLEGGGYGSFIDDSETTRFDLGPGDIFSVTAHRIHQVGADSRGMIMLAVSIGSLPLTDANRLRIIE
jgi:quercetin dioxygenase-like cupin family protein